MSDSEYTCCFTGYRPQKFPFPIKGDCPDYIRFENDLTDKLFELYDAGCKTFISGMAMGFDIIAANAVLTLRQAGKNVKLVCAVPFKGQEEKFPFAWKKRYAEILAEADEVVILSPSYYHACFMDRNKYMVDRSDFILTFYDGQSGGTKNTVIYAEKCGRTVINIL